MLKRAAGIGALSLAKPLLSFAQNPTSAIAHGGSLSAPRDGEIIVVTAITTSVTDIDYVGPCAVFDCWMYDEVAKRAMRKFKTVTVGERREPNGDRGGNIVPDYTFEDVPNPHVVIVPAQAGSPKLVEWLRGVSKTADVTMSVCIGARHLAKAGLLDGQKATTHHAFIPQFSTEFPRVEWVKGARFIEGTKISTGGGLTAGIDLGLRVYERYFGRAAAQAAAAHLEYGGLGWMV